jgi:hypothetical protein
MARVCKVVQNARGALVGYNELPLRFDTAAQAIQFMNWYVAAVFAGGKCGYQREGRYWWGCDDSSELELHRYAVDPSA